MSFCLLVVSEFYEFIFTYTGDDKNKRFVEDFKTLADVLIQETVRHDLGTKVCYNTQEIPGQGLI